MESADIWVDRGDGKNFGFLAVDTVPDYTKTAALPAVGTSALWKYKVTNLHGNDRVGQWLDAVNILVAGRGFSKGLTDPCEM